jgi:prepilin-type N-terminal cleavage/methylation domain-containing protein
MRMNAPIVDKNRIWRGYTLLEMLVAVGLFSVVMLTASAAYLTLIDLDRQARATNDVVSNLSFAVDSMSRATRTGTNYECNMINGNNCPTTPGTSIEFTDESGRTIDYELLNGQMIATINGSASALTDSRITIQTLNFYVRGVGTGDGIQPQVTFIIMGVLTTGPGKTVNFSIEGGATQRVLEI